VFAIIAVGFLCLVVGASIGYCFFKTMKPKTNTVYKRGIKTSVNMNESSIDDLTMLDDSES